MAGEMNVQGQPDRSQQASPTSPNKSAVANQAASPEVENPYASPTGAHQYAEQSARRHLRRIARHIAGWSLLALGVVGLFLPILQGWLFIVVAALLLAPDVPVFRRLLDWIEMRFPPLRALIKKFRGRR